MLLGPFADPSKGIGIPPAWEPVADSIALLLSVPPAILNQDTEPAKRRLYALVSDVTNFIPGSLMAKQLAAGAKREGAKGALSSLVGYRPPKERD